jgi:hypothetical protein
MKSKNCPEETATALTNLMIKLPGKMGRSKRSINEQTRINLYKYGTGKSFPLISTLFAFCFAMELDPGWLVTIACKVQQGKISEAHALEILSNHDSHKETISTLNHVALQEILKEFPIRPD